MNLKHFSIARTLLIVGSLAGMVLTVNPSQAQNDPPFGSARVARIQGSVSIQPSGEDDWGQAYSNQPLGPGDRLYTDQQGRGEIQASVVRAYFNANSDVTLVDNTLDGVQIGVAQGSVDIYSDGFPPNEGTVSIQTPNGAITVSARAGFRVDVYPDEESSVVTNYGGSAEVALNGAGGFSMYLHQGESIQLSGTNPVYAQPLRPVAYDDFQRWSMAFEGRRENSISARYVSNEMPGYDQLDDAGDWQPQSDYGPIWFPHVEAGWAPYHNGHWVNVPPYGWTWVADEPWGAAPFHYGRWAVVGGRWGWIPGPRESHPVWSPAQVVFAGGVQVGGAGVSVWFPLGPGEAYKPWYPCSPAYVNRINITNIHESRVVHVQTTYVNVVNVTNVTYVNRTVGVTAMRQEDFAAGHSTKAVAVRVDPRQLEHVQAAAPAARPPAQRIILNPVARPAAVQQQRPVLVNNKGQQAPAAPNARPVAVPVKTAPPAPRPIPGHEAAGAPIVGGKPVVPAPANSPANIPATSMPGNRPAPNQPTIARPAIPATTQPAPVTPTAPNQPTTVRPAAPAITTPTPANRPLPNQPTIARPAIPATVKPPLTPTAPNQPPAARPGTPPATNPGPANPGPANRPLLNQPQTPRTVTPPPTPPVRTAPPAAEPKPVPTPPTRAQPVAPETKPTRPNDTRPGHPNKDDKKKEERKPEDKKPE